MADDVRAPDPDQFDAVESLEELEQDDLPFDGDPEELEVGDAHSA